MCNCDVVGSFSSTTYEVPRTHLKTHWELHLYMSEKHWVKVVIYDNDFHQKRALLGRVGWRKASLFGVVGLTVQHAQGTRRSALTAHLPIASTNRKLRIATGVRKHRNLVELHGPIKQS